jgi:hypothetical protein
VKICWSRIKEENSYNFLYINTRLYYCKDLRLEFRADGRRDGTRTAQRTQSRLSTAHILRRRVPHREHRGNVAFLLNKNKCTLSLVSGLTITECQRECHKIWKTMYDFSSPFCQIIFQIILSVLESILDKKIRNSSENGPSKPKLTYVSSSISMTLAPKLRRASEGQHLVLTLPHGSTARCP